MCYQVACFDIKWFTRLTRLVRFRDKSKGKPDSQALCNTQVEALKELTLFKISKIRCHIQKATIVTITVVILGSSSIGLLFLIVCISSTLPVSSSLFHDIDDYIIIPSITHDIHPPSFCIWAVLQTNAQAHDEVYKSIVCNNCKYN